MESNDTTTVLHSAQYASSSVWLRFRRISLEMSGRIRHPQRSCFFASLSEGASNALMRTFKEVYSLHVLPDVGRKFHVLMSKLDPSNIIRQLPSQTQPFPSNGDDKMITVQRLLVSMCYA